MCWWPEQHRTAAPLRSSASWWPSRPRQVVDGDKKAVRARAKDIAAGDWAGAAVKKAINAVNEAQAAIIIGAAAGAAVVRLG